MFRKIGREYLLDVSRRSITLVISLLIYSKMQCLNESLIGGLRGGGGSGDSSQ